MKNLLSLIIAVAFIFSSAFAQVTSIGLIGTGSPNGNWDDDVDLTQSSMDTAMWSGTMTLQAGQVKFRANDEWVMDWGAGDFPMGVGEQGGANIPVVGGEYNISFNHVTGAYNFESTSPLYGTMGISGSSVGMAEVQMEKNPTNPNLWSYNGTFTDGMAFFRADEDDNLKWGGSDFPMGTGTIGADGIPVTAGDYKVTLNSATGEYNFGPAIRIFPTVGIIGDGTAVGWDSDIDMTRDAINADDWAIEINLAAGGMKFRAENDWIVDWGSSSFPVGNGTQGGDNIPVVPGNWAITLNATSGFYTFTPASIGIIGNALAGGWDVDEDMTASGTEGFVWKVNFTAVADGAVKFRKDDDWAINWGAEDFPSGTGTQGGADIPITAGDYEATLNTLTGEYSFSPLSSTDNILDANQVNVFPNPATNELNIQVKAAEMQGEVDVIVLDLNGKAISTSAHNASGTIKTNVSNLSAGMYFLQVRNEKYIVNKRFTIAK